jgi:hypothetical protein
VVKPDQVIEPYDATVADRRPFGGPPLSPREFDHWLYAHVQAWRCRYVTAQDVPRLVVLAGREYWHCLAEHGLEVCVPLDGLPIGRRLHWLKQQTDDRPFPADGRLRLPALFPDFERP